MALKIVENITHEDVELIDMGITIASGGNYDLTTQRREIIVNSEDLLKNVALGNLVLQKDSLSEPIEYYTTAEAIHVLHDFYEKNPKSKDGYKIAVHSSAKPERKLTEYPYHTHWTGAGDDLENHIIGAGQPALIQNEIGVPIKSVDINFDPIFGNLFIYEGYIGFKNAGFGDQVSISFCAKATPTQQLANLDLVLDGDKLAYSLSGPGTGTHGFADIPTIVPNYNKTGYWNYDEALQDLYPSFDQTGLYDIYVIDKEVDIFINRLPLLGDTHGFVFLEASDYTQLPPNYFMKITCYNNSNTEWVYFSFIECYRERSVDIDF